MTNLRFCPVNQREQRAKEVQEKADEIARFQDTQTRVGLGDSSKAVNESSKRSDSVAKVRHFSEQRDKY